MSVRRSERQVVCKFGECGMMNLQIDLDASPNPEFGIRQLEASWHRETKKCWNSVKELIGPDPDGLDRRITKNQAVKDGMIQWKTQWFTTFIESKQYNMLSAVDKLCEEWPSRIRSYVQPLAG